LKKPTKEEEGREGGKNHQKNQGHLEGSQFEGRIIKQSKWDKKDQTLGELEGEVREKGKKAMDRKKTFWEI